MIAVQKLDRYSSLAVLFGVAALLTAIGLGALTKVYYDQTTARFERSSDKLLALQTEVARLLVLAPDGSFTDSNFSIYNDPDFLRLFCFKADQLTPNQKRIYTAPDVNGTLALFSDIPTVFAPDTATYLTLTTNPTLVNERVLVMSNATFDVVDLGPGDAFQVNLKDTGVTPGTYVRATLTVNAKGLVTNASANAAGSITCPVEFADNTFSIVGAADPNAAVQFNVTDLTPGITRTMTIQSTGGIIAYLSDFSTVFPDDTFRVENTAVPSKKVGIDCFSISSGFTRTLTIQDASGVIAYVPDTSAIYPDNVFAIFDQVTTSKRAVFDASGISPNTTRTYIFPDISGELLLTSGAQSLTNKNIQGGTNIVDATVLRTSAVGVNVDDSAPPNAGDILVTSAGGTQAVWADRRRTSGAWIPTFSGAFGLSGNPINAYANYQQIGNLVFCTMQINGYSTNPQIEDNSLIFRVSLPLPRADGNFPVSPVAAAGIGTFVYVDTVNTNNFRMGSIRPVAGTELVQYTGSIERLLVNPATFSLQFMYEF